MKASLQFLPLLMPLASGFQCLRGFTGPGSSFWNDLLNPGMELDAARHNTPLIPANMAEVPNAAMLPPQQLRGNSAAAIGTRPFTPTPRQRPDRGKRGKPPGKKDSSSFWHGIRPQTLDVVA